MPVLSTLCPPLELQRLILSFLRVEDLWSLQMTCHSNRASVQNYLKNKFHHYLSEVLDNTTGNSIQKLVCNMFLFFDNLPGGCALMLSRFLEISDAIIVGAFCLAMMADEHEGLNWSFDSLQIIVPSAFVTLLEEYFDRSGNEWSVDNPFMDNTPLASPHELLDFTNSQSHFDPTSSELTKSPGKRGISIFVCDRNEVIKYCADAPSTVFASFVTPSALFCAYPAFTFGQYALAMNRLPSTASLYWHSIFQYKMQVTNMRWNHPCDDGCPSLFRRLTSSFAIIPFSEPREDITWMLGSNRWWKIRADCRNQHCPYFGTYLV
ncbi:hypothetical protein F5887DRAFT_1079044 [Amanita rubescens]|nr:hypothetical protein F5887DRAFT_1079044 [Amanita rubescens]